MELSRQLFRRFLRRPGLPSHLAAVLWLGLVVVGSSNVGVGLVLFFLIFFGAVFLGGLWTLHALIYFFRTARLGMKSPLRPGEIVA